MRISGMKALAADSVLNGCIEAVVTPKLGSQIEYRRGDDKYFRITIDPPSEGGIAYWLHFNGEVTREFSQTVIFEATDECPGHKPMRLTIWGPAQFGDILRPPSQDGTIVPAALITGKVAIYARAHDRLLGLPFPPSIYLVNSFELPPGSVLSAPADEPNSAWIGTAIVDTNTAGLSIQAESSSHSITLRQAGASGGSRQSDPLIDLGSYAQYLTDPNIIKIQFLIAAFFVLFQVGFKIMSVFDKYLFRPPQNGDT